MKRIIKSFKTRNLNKREKVLLLILLIVFIFWSSHSLVLKPQAEKIVHLNEEMILLDNELSSMNHMLENEKDIRDEISQIKSTIINIGNSYYQILDQSQLIYYLEDVFNSNGLVVKNMDFNETQLLNINDLEVQYITTSIPFEGKYDEVEAVIRDLNNGPFKVIIESFFLRHLNKQILEGEMIIQVFCLENIIDIPSKNIVLLPRDVESNYENFNPFEDEDEAEINGDSDNGNFSTEVSNNIKNIESPKENSNNKKEILNKSIIDNFNNIGYEFISSHESIKGSIDLYSDYNNNYLRFEYFIKGNGSEINRAYIDMGKRNIKFNYPISKLYLTMKSFNYSTGNLGIGFMTQDEEIIDVIISKGISWTGWNTVEFSLPSELTLYPLKLKHIYFDIPGNREDIGVLIFDKLEMVLQNYNDEVSDFYMVNEGDTVANISLKIYGSDEYVDDILKDNNLSSPNDLNPGKILILKRR